MGDFIVPVVLQFVGVAVIIAEFILPSAGVLTLAALCCFGYSIYHVFRFVSAATGFWFVGADVIVIPVLVIAGMKFLANSPVTLRSSLSRLSGVASQDSGLSALVGLTGTTLSDCRPAGKARIDGRKYDVVSEGDYIDTGREITVAAVNGNRIVVRPKNP